MNNRKLARWQIAGVFIIFVLASAWHFVYEWLPSNIIASIAPVNESPWEHVKLFFFPALIFYIIQYIFVGKDYKNYIFAHAISLLIMPLVMLILFYGYQFLLDIDHNLFLDILITFVTIAIGSYVAYKITISQKDFNKSILGILIIIAVFAMEAYFTFYPPELPMFYDETQDTYGIVEEL